MSFDFLYCVQNSALCFVKLITFLCVIRCCLWIKQGTVNTHTFFFFITETKAIMRPVMYGVPSVAQAVMLKCRSSLFGNNPLESKYCFPLFSFLAKEVIAL